MSKKDQAEKLYDAITQLSDDLLLEAEQTALPKKKKTWVRWAGLAAAVTLVAGASWIGWQQTGEDFASQNMAGSEDAAGSTELYATDTPAEVALTEESAAEAETEESATDGATEAAVSDTPAEGDAGTEGSASNSTAETSAQDRIADTAETATASSRIGDFGFRLLSILSEEGESTSVSPVSVLSALGMTANGAEGETRSQIEDTLGFSTQELNESLQSYLDGLKENGDENLFLANSVWCRKEGFKANPQFVDTVSDVYDAELYRKKMDDKTKDEINRWVEKNTDGMIPRIIDELREEDVMVLVNALAFEAKWEDPYTDVQIREDWFTTDTGKQESVDYLMSTEATYLENDMVTGVLKYYENRDYAFVAMLPKKGYSTEDLLENMNGKTFEALLENRTVADVHTWIPRFQADESAELSEELFSMGIQNLFDSEAADLQGIGTSDTNLFVSRILHRTHISVDEKGTKAAAASAVTLTDGGTESAIATKSYEVLCNRPFLYALIDTKTNTPFFLGVVSDPTQQ